MWLYARSSRSNFSISRKCTIYGQEIWKYGQDANYSEFWRYCLNVLRDEVKGRLKVLRKAETIHKEGQQEEDTIKILQRSIPVYKGDRDKTKI